MENRRVCSFSQIRYRLLAAAVSIVAAAPLAQPVNAQDRSRDHDMMRGGGDRSHDGGVHGMGTGAAVGIGIDILRGISSGSPNASDNNTTTKKPPDKKQHNVKPPEKPPTHNADIPPKTPDNPPTTTKQPPVTTGGPPPPPPTDSPPPTQTSSSPPPDQPKTPTAPPPRDPNDVPVPQTPYGHDIPQECPQRGMGCAALIIDFKTHYLGDLDPLKDHLLANKACEVEYFTSKFLNADERNRMNDAIARHRERVARGAEIAIEIVRGEGYPAELRTCGSVGPDKGGSLNRQEFVAGNYTAANKHVCEWVVADYSCYSGYTAEIFDEMNNRGPNPALENSTQNGCVGVQANNCSQHAAYDFDLAVGQSRSSLPACALFTPALRKGLIGALAQQNNSIKIDKTWGHTGYGSSYSDQGYRYCDPITREGYKSEPPTTGVPETVAPIGERTVTNPK